MRTILLAVIATVVFSGSATVIAADRVPVYVTSVGAQQGFTDPSKVNGAHLAAKVVPHDY